MSEGHQEPALVFRSPHAVLEVSRAWLKHGPLKSSVLC